MTTTITPYLSFPGTTREAYAFYAKALGATIQTMMSYADMPAPPPSADPGCAGGAMPPVGDPATNPMPFDGKRMIFGGFRPVVVVPPAQPSSKGD